jgi:arylsulfatase
VPGTRRGTLLIDGEPAGSLETTVGFNNFISWSGLDIGRDRGSPVSHYEAPFEFTGRLSKVTMTLESADAVDDEGAAQVQLSRE